MVSISQSLIKKSVVSRETVVALRWRMSQLILRLSIVESSRDGTEGVKQTKTLAFQPQVLTFSGTFELTEVPSLFSSRPHAGMS